MPHLRRPTVAVLTSLAVLLSTASTILAGFYCFDRVPFRFEGELGTPARDYRSFSQAEDEAGRSRILNGIHFQFSNEDGRRAGNAIGREIVTTRLRRAGRCVGILCACPQL
jgi:hypothetical protein